MDNKSEKGFEFWNRVFLLLDEQKMSQTELARKAGITPQTISVARLKGNIPSVVKGDKIAKALGVPLEFLLYGETSKVADPVFLSYVNLLKDNRKARDIIKYLTKLNNDELSFIVTMLKYMGADER